MPIKESKMTAHTANEAHKLCTAGFHPTPALQLAGQGAIGGSGVGFLVSTVRNALETHNKGAMGVFTRTGSTISYFAAVGATFAFTETAVSNVRGDQDAISSAAGGCAAGSLIGARSKSIPAAAGGCLLFGALMGAFQAAGGTLTAGIGPHPSLEERSNKRESFATLRQVPGGSKEE
ncbi:hypothetical protein E3P92_02012 [Wallemia ichthyophaga]|nr:hypothetical protein E3P91_02230 [Wallemia ichthyophaga]TIA94060.1 hypothetical protein E3P97_00511 [Wallemia ichthyophaga]TIA99910.1 hypothetical protein E3P96_02808 [Wallemia ichthyophaga]TIB04314.1 hypothetical protein E3P95_00319 [Wallemia ichthyophaga]TIB05461.1 hypothetical protein E3P94_00319 [Wallemia ichthyophaga]